MKINSKINIINELTKFIKSKFVDKYNFKCHTQKYELRELVTEFIYILETGVSYSKIRSHISKSNINKHFIFLSKNGVFLEFYKYLLYDYFKKDKCLKLKYQLIDTSFIRNQYGFSKNMGRNVQYKSKKGYKLSCLTDVNGIPFSILLNKGSYFDGNFVEEHFNNLIIAPIKRLSATSRKYKRYMLADSIYDSKKIKNKLKNLNIHLIVPPNIRNTKDEQKINEKQLTDKEKKIYKNRIRVENSFCYLQKNRRCQIIYDKYITTFLSFIYLGFSKRFF